MTVGKQNQLWGIDTVLDSSWSTHLACSGSYAKVFDSTTPICYTVFKQIPLHMDQETSVCFVQSTKTVQS